MSMRNPLLYMFFLLCGMQAGCMTQSIFLLPQEAQVSPIDYTLAAVYKLTEMDPPGGPALVTVSSRGVARATLQSGELVALLHVRVLFKNRTGVDVTFNADAATAFSPEIMQGTASPVYVQPDKKRVTPELISQGSQGSYDIYYVLGPPAAISRIRTVVFDWKYTLGEKPFGTQTVFIRSHAPPGGYAYGSSSTYYDRGTYSYEPFSAWWWWPLHIGFSIGSGPSYSPSPGWRRR